MSRPISFLTLISALAIGFAGCAQTAPPGSAGSDTDVPPLDGDDEGNDQDTAGDDVTDDHSQGTDGTDGTDNTDDTRPGGDPPPNNGGDDDGSDPTDPNGGDVPTGPCTDDGYEDNDDISMATILSGDAITDLVACPEDDDWFALDMDENESLILDLTFLNEDGDIDVRVEDAAGTFILSGSSGSDNEHLNVQAGAAGTYYVRVYLYGDGGADVGNSYSMSVNEPPTCPADSFEQNQTEATAAAISVGAYSALNVCELDQDWYAIDATAGQTISVLVNFLHAEGDVDATLYDPNSTWVTGGSSVTDNEELGPYTVTTDGIHMLNVRLYSDAGSAVGNSYDLDVTVN